MYNYREMLDKYKEKEAIDSSIIIQSTDEYGATTRYRRDIDEAKGIDKRQLILIIENRPTLFSKMVYWLINSKQKASDRRAIFDEVKDVLFSEEDLKRLDDIKAEYGIKNATPSQNVKREDTIQFILDLPDHNSASGKTLCWLIDSQQSAKEKQQDFEAIKDTLFSKEMLDGINEIKEEYAATKSE